MTKPQNRTVNDQPLATAAENRDRFQEAYTASLRLWPVPYETVYVPTRFGQTHVVTCGREDAPPLVLLHGAMFSSTMWYPNVEAWSESYRIYAIDIIGDKNLSIPEAGCASRAEYAAWLLEVWDALGIHKPNLLGLSLGGMHALNLLVRAPERIERAVILSPAESLVPLHPDFYSHAFGLLQPDGDVRFLEWMFADRYLLPRPFLEQFRAAIAWRDEARSGLPKENGFPYVYTDEELQSIRVPLLLMWGENEVIYDPRSAMERAGRLIPEAQTILVPQAGHVLSMESAAYVNQAASDFFKGTRPSPPALPPA